MYCESVNLPFSIGETVFWFRDGKNEANKHSTYSAQKSNPEVFYLPNSPTDPLVKNNLVDELMAVTNNTLKFHTLSGLVAWVYTGADLLLKQRRIASDDVKAMTYGQVISHFNKGHFSRIIHDV
ncbi:hypothetical protein [uncultured Kiloniella sp.]|uniref:hypothetical protein n=1 Tax=uncultured Kiloniella sp. TaxID=1133091 RepID=UPI00260900A1|nr:hypothetical protein [uncultured Kiloniella sp.]